MQIMNHFYLKYTKNGFSYTLVIIVHTTKDIPSAHSSTNQLSKCSLGWSHTLSPVDFFCFFTKLHIFRLSNRVMYLLFTAVCKIQISFSLNVNVQRSCSSALNAMLTTRGTSGSASNCREESDISDRRVQPGS